MALGDLLNMLAMPGGPQYPQGPNLANPMAPQPQTPGQVPQMALPTASASPQPATTPASSAPTGALMPDGPDTIAGHHVSNLLNLTGSLTPPQGVQAPTGQTQANILGGYTPPSGPTPAQPDPTQNVPSPQGYQTPNPVSDPTGGDPHYYEKHVNGPFKTHGVIGDILGHVMDAALVSAGLKPEYTQRSMAAKQADAINGYQNDPTGAFMRLAATGGVPEATAFQTGTDADVAAHNKVATDAADLQVKQNLAKLKAQATLITARKQQQNLAGTLIGMDPKDPKTIALAKQVSAQIAQMRAQYPDDTDPVPETPEDLQSFANASITPDQRVRAQNTKDHEDAMEEEAHARTGIAAANSSIAGRRADIAASQAASANAYRAYKMAHPGGSASDPEYKALKTQYLKNSIALQGQRSAVTSTYKGVADPLADDEDDDADPDTNVGGTPPAPSGGGRKVTATKTIGNKTYVNYGGGPKDWHVK